MYIYTSTHDIFHVHLTHTHTVRISPCLPPQDMTPVQLSEEKHSVQRTLLHFEKVYGRPVSHTTDSELLIVKLN